MGNLKALQDLFSHSVGDHQLSEELSVRTSVDTLLSPTE